MLMQTALIHALPWRSTKIQNNAMQCNPGFAAGSDRDNDLRNMRLLRAHDSKLQIPRKRGAPQDQACCVVLAVGRFAAVCMCDMILIVNA